ncbi:YraN family protein [Epibacterium sp. MM17-32]|uniref:YraN family protein n=1 Tax=Epibacterium sp. MM17-32 TaxID=2917734 RepID=UPI001EF46B1D|nr:YraN family protein [Epibacterium sp. MM17-32]MCG7629247.1 YraN family protein [Epibacterium sp. MM17-32]
MGQGKRATGQRSHIAGAAAEEIAIRAYLARGYAVAETRWRGPHGEIDLILRDGDGVIFAEVKSSATRDAAAARIRPAQMQRVMASAAAFLDAEPKGQLTDARLDVVLVWGAGEVEIIENAYGHG